MQTFTTEHTERSSIDPKRYYDEIGWTHDAEGVYDDARRFEDLRPVTQPYIRRCHARVARHLREGRHLLDVASGPLQYPEYLAYGEAFERRLCMDISFRALQEARRRLGQRGFYVVADISALPVREGAVDAALSLHTIYHVRADRQLAAFKEIERVLRPGGSAAVVYSWGHRSLLNTVALAPLYLWRRVAKVVGRLLSTGSRSASAGTEQSGDLYFHCYGPDWFLRQKWSSRVELHAWRSVSVPFTRTYVHAKTGGRRLLRVIAWFEERFPRVAGILGQYPLIVIRKPR
jgi:ubiquinone/menaquinone biosynthesis C-methylase UbiE